MRQHKPADFAPSHGPKLELKLMAGALLLILAMIAMAAFKLFAPNRRNHDAVRRDLVQLHEAIAAFTEASGHPPASFDECLPPSKIPVDPWGRPYTYISAPDIDIESYGRDGVPGGAGEDADLAWSAIRDER